MFTRLPDLVDPLFYAEQRRQIKAKVPQFQCPRLLKAISEANGEILVEMDFFRQKQTGAPAFDLRLKTELKLRCQRSLQVFDLPVDVCIQGVFLPSMQLADELDADWEVYNLPDDKISLLPIIEDEVLLAIPMAPKLADEAMPWPDSLKSDEVDECTDKPNPFSALAKLKSQLK
ncbi:DUF177 domain-containing protein [Thiomicrospira sp. ALE5]|uniref:YceD family protein n=1 Tax=Thiomicrospira sp. ALE5 TaxID=748650 RepID=UPI0008EBF81A|nr:YceD family protein [Thiomicrospira sp. ALE5]SFR52178.1 uncharacterized protein SAMN03092900_0637 [Thiomicrospira sp. ALE5]